jgi:hypothetical protein
MGASRLSLRTRHSVQVLVRPLSHGLEVRSEVA